MLVRILEQIPWMLRDNCNSIGLWAARRALLPNKINHANTNVRSSLCHFSASQGRGCVCERELRGGGFSESLKWKTFCFVLFCFVLFCFLPFKATSMVHGGSQTRG